MAFRRLAKLWFAIWSLGLVGGSLWFFHRELASTHLRAIEQSAAAIPRPRLALALALTGLSYALQIGYDVLALRTVGRSVPKAALVQASFLGQAFGNTIGLPLLGGAPPRIRIYAAAGLTPVEIAVVLGSTSVTFFLGLLTLAGLLLVGAPEVLAAELGIPRASTVPLGGVALAIVAGCVGLLAFFRRRTRATPAPIPLPGPGLVLAQAAVGATDIALAGGALILLLPPGTIRLAAALGAYVLALAPGVLSQVPGGLGVFEAAFSFFAGDRMPAAALAASLVTYRVVYYLAPLAVALLVLGLVELRDRRQDLFRIARAITVPPWLPTQILACMTLFGGALLLFSGATPATQSRMAWLERALPLPVIELSHFAGSLIGIALLFLANGLLRRLDAAYVLTALLLFLGAMASLLKGLDYEEAIFLLFLLLALLPCRRHFYRRTSLFAAPFTASWTVAVVAVLSSSIWLGLFAYKHVEYSHRLWWQFAIGAGGAGDASRFLRASTGAAALVLTIALARLWRATPPAPEPITDPARARALIDASPDTNAYLALLGDKRFLWSENRNAFLMYAIEGRTWVAMGDPVGDESEWPELVWRFRELAAHYEGYPAYFQVRANHLPLYLDLGLLVVKLGEEARVPLATFSLEGPRRSALRQAERKAEREGASFVVLPPSEVVPELPALRAVSDAWLAHKRTREKRFSLGTFDADYVAACPVAVVKRAGAIVAFANLWAGSAREEAAIDMMRHTPEAHGVMDYLFIELLVWAKANGYHWFNLGMAPLTGFESRPLAPLWNRLAALAYAHGEAFYNFRGLRKYKEKFDPVWEPRYLVSPGGLVLPRNLASIALLTSGGLRGLWRK
jgi:phosphatidylglycerol lysyltransferase